MSNRPRSVKHNRGVYETLTARTDHLADLGPTCQRIIADLQRAEQAKPPLKRHNPYELQQRVIAYGERLFRAERRIIREAPEIEWFSDDRLQAIHLAMNLQLTAECQGLAMSLKTDHCSLHLHHLKIPCEYKPEQLQECEKILTLYRTHSTLPDCDPPL